MSFQRPPLGLGEDTSIRGSPRKEQDFRGSAILHQQRRLKQATQFVHKDSADLLPLDQLRRLGTSKDLEVKQFLYHQRGRFSTEARNHGNEQCICDGKILPASKGGNMDNHNTLQPHSVIQRRLMGGSPVKETSGLAHVPNLCGQEAQSPKVETRPSLQEEDQSLVPNQLLPTKQPEERPVYGWKGHALLVPCKVGTMDICAKLSTERQENLMSKACVKRLGLQTTNGPQEKIIVNIELGRVVLTSKAVIVDDDTFEFCMGLETLISFKTCIDLEHGVLKTPTQEIPFMNASAQRATTEKMTETVSNSSGQ